MRDASLEELIEIRFDYVKGVTMDHFFLKMKEILLNKSLKIYMDDKK